MKTKIFTISAVFIFLTITMQAQIGFGILGGINFQNLNGKNSSGYKLKNDLAPGFHVGGNIQLQVAPDFFFQPGILFTTKGANDNDASPSLKYRISYLELPLNMVYKGLLGKGYFMIGLGPYLGYGIGGKVKFDNGATSKIEFRNVVEANETSMATFLRAFDAGGNIFVGYELASGIFIQLNTQLGMLKINPEDRRISNDISSIKNTGFGFSAGYRF
jgi:hypothetical protein